MKKLAFIILMGSLVTSAFAKGIDITQSKGTEQSVIVSLTPKPAFMDTDRNVTLEAVFNVLLDETSVQKNNIKLKKITENKESTVNGEVAYDAAKNAVTFKPSTLLTHGYYEVEFKSLKATKADKDQQIKEIKYRFYVPEVINGYKLPVEPDPAVNNATLLGVDSNDNGVRDDVERKIVIQYVKPIEIELMLSYVRKHQEMLTDPDGSAIESEKKMSKVIDCSLYLDDYGIRIDDMVSFTENNIYNTKERVKAYLDFNQALKVAEYMVVDLQTGMQRPVILMWSKC